MEKFISYLPYFIHGAFVAILWNSPIAPLWMQISYTVLAVAVLVWYWRKMEQIKNGK